MSMSIKAFDLFCSVGGLTYGLRRSGVHVTAGVDADGSCKYAYEANNGGAKFIKADIQAISYEKHIASHLEGADYKVLVGCAPCQPFSTHNQKNRGREKTDDWKLLKQFLRLIREGRPDVVSMENVPLLRNKLVYQEFIDGLKELKYKVNLKKMVSCAQYGVPQNRRRLVLLASLHGAIELLPAMERPRATVKETIGHLPPLRTGEQDASDPLHICSSLTPLNIKRIKASKPGGTWRDWPPELLPECYKKPSGQTYSSVYGRMLASKPSPVITTQFYRYGTGRFGHPKQDRGLSLREGALLQTFPTDYEFFPEGEPVKMVEVGRHIGNAVPPKMAEHIGRSIVKHLEEINV